MLGSSQSKDGVQFILGKTANSSSSTHDGPMSIAKITSDRQERLKTITLKILSANESCPIRTLSLPCIIGRVADHRGWPTNRNGLFTSRFLSRNHAEIKLEDYRLIIEDMGSCNGTFVNGVSLKAGEAWPLSEGDLLQFGSEDDNANNAAIVAQVFYDQQSSKQENNYNELMVLDNPFTMMNNNNESASKLNRLPTSAHTISSDEISAKIADITRSLASFGVEIRTNLTMRARYSHRGTLQVLESIEGLIHDLSTTEDLLQTNGIRTSTATINTTSTATNTTNTFSMNSYYAPAPTIHQQPNLAIALRIIDTYEIMLCALVFLISIWVVW